MWKGLAADKKKIYGDRAAEGKSIKGKNVAEVAKKAGEMWKSLSADKKKIYEDRASKAKAEYAAYVAKVKDTEGFKAFKDELAVARKNRLKRSVKSATRKKRLK